MAGSLPCSRVPQQCAEGLLGVLALLPEHPLDRDLNREPSTPQLTPATLFKTVTPGKAAEIGSKNKKKSYCFEGESKFASVSFYVTGDTLSCVCCWGCCLQVLILFLAVFPWQRKAFST